MQKIVLMLLSLLTMSACETMQGFKTRSDNFPQLENLTCLDEAVKKTAEVEFISSEKTFDDRAKAFWSEKKIQRKAYVVRYKIKGLDQLVYYASVSVTDESSEDPRPSYNHRDYYNGFGRTNGSPYSDEVLVKGRAAVDAVNESVRKACGLKDFKLDTRIDSY